MATPIDLGVVSTLAYLFPFLLVTIVTYAIMGKAEIFSNNKGIHLIVAVFLGMILLFSPIVIKSINAMAPWFVLLFLIILFLLITYQLFGIKESTITEIVTGKEYGSTFAWWVIVIIIIIAAANIGKVVSEEKTNTQTQMTGINEQPQTTTTTQLPSEANTLLNPKILGGIVLLLIALFTVVNLAGKPS